MKTIYRMDRNNPVTSAYMPYVVQRAMTFCVRYETETRPIPLANHLWMLYASGDRRLGLWIVVDDFKIVAHLLAQPEHMDAKPEDWQYLLIRQADVDKGVDTRSENVQVMTEVEQWAGTLGIQRLMMVTHRRGAAMARRWGFKQYKTLMHKDISQKGSVSASEQA